MISFFFSIQGVSIENVVNSGPGLVFITYPEVVLKLPGGPIWAVTFFVMLVVKYLDLFENLLLIWFVVLVNGKKNFIRNSVFQISPEKFRLSFFILFISPMKMFTLNMHLLCKKSETNICKQIKQWPLAPNSPKWQITRANVSRRVTFLSKVANVEHERMYRVRGKWLANVGECIESGESGWRMSGECIESGESGWRMSGECIESDQNRLANVGASKKGCFMHK